MNHMPEIAKMLGVEIGEEFTIIPIGGRYRISQSGLQFLSEKGEWVLSKYLKALLTGEYGTVKIPPELKDGEIREYVLKLDGNYYAGRGKYVDVIMLSGTGALGAKRFTYEEAEQSRKHFTKNGFVCTIEKYEPKQYTQECLEKIIKYENERRKGNNPGYGISNNAEYAMKYLEEWKK